jgi:hypothetical protein
LGGFGNEVSVVDCPHLWIIGELMKKGRISFCNVYNSLCSFIIERVGMEDSIVTGMI